MIANAFRSFKHRRRLARAIAEIAARPGGPGRPHGLPRPLIVSLTSYPVRFATLDLTLRSLLCQSVQPDRVILWVAEDDLPQLPDDIPNRPGLEVRGCPDWRSFKKIIPALLAHPEAFVVTADDDVYYPHRWLEKLVEAADAGARVACWRAHHIALRDDGLPAPYTSWRHNVSVPEASPLTFLTGVSGVLYAPGALHRDVVRDDLFRALAPRADDVWLYWMHRLNGVEARKIGPRARILEWQGSQDHSLRSENLHGAGNDTAIAAMIGHYGWPR